MDQRRRLAGSGSGDDQQRIVAVHRGGSLGFVQTGQQRRDRFHRILRRGVLVRPPLHLGVAGFARFRPKASSFTAPNSVPPVA
jgi:hypothetical protein